MKAQGIYDISVFVRFYWRDPIRHIQRFVVSVSAGRLLWSMESRMWVGRWEKGWMMAVRRGIMMRGTGYGPGTNQGRSENTSRQSS